MYVTIIESIICLFLFLFILFHIRFEFQSLKHRISVICFNIFLSLLFVTIGISIGMVTQTIEANEFTLPIKAIFSNLKNILSISFVNALIPSIISASVIMIFTGRKESYILKCLIIVAVIIAHDVVNAPSILYIFDPNNGKLLYVIGDIIGGIILVFLLSKIYQNIFRIDYIKLIKLAHTSCVAILLSTLTIFIFYYNYKKLVIVEIKDWRKIQFHYVKSVSKHQDIIDLLSSKFPQIPGTRPIIEVILNPASFNASLIGDNLKVHWGFSLNEDRKFSTNKTEFEEYLFDDRFKVSDSYQLLRGDLSKIPLLGRRTDRIEINEGKLEISGKNTLVILKNEENQQWSNSMRVILLMPINERIIFTRKLKEFNTFAKTEDTKNSSDESNNRKGPLAIITKAGIFPKVITKGKLCMLLCTPEPSFFDSKEKSLRIKFPESENPMVYKEPFLRDPNIPYPVALLNIGKDGEEKFFSMNGLMDRIEFFECDYRFESNGIRTIIGGLIVTEPKGQLTIGDKKYILSGTDELNVGGDDLQLEQNGNDLFFKGNTEFITINGDRLPLTIWAQFSSEVKNGLFAVVAAVLGAILVLMFQNNSNKTSDSSDNPRQSVPEQQKRKNIKNRRR